MTTTAIRQRLMDYMQIADERKIKAIYTMVEDDLNTIENSWDQDFITELEKRNREFISGKVKTYTWEETKAAAIKNFALKK